MIKQTAIVIISLILTHSAFAQDITIKGKVVDSLTREAIPGTNVFIQGTNIGVTSSNEGAFELKISLEYEQVTFSRLGYEPKSILIKHFPDQETTISLKEQILPPIIIKPKNPLDTIRKAIERISENYIDNPVYLTCFHRSLVKKRNVYIRLKEVVAKMYYEGYNIEFDKKKAEEFFFQADNNNDDNITVVWSIYDFITNPNDQAKIIALYKSSDFDNREYNHFIAGEPLGITAADCIKYKKHFLESKNLKNYEYEYEGTTTLNNINVYKISFKPKKTSKNTPFEGKIYVEDSSLAIIRVEIKQVHKWNSYYPSYKMSVDYKKYNNRWCLYKIEKEEMVIVSFSTDYTDTLSIKHEFIVTDLQNEDVKPFSKEEIFPNKIQNQLYKLDMPFEEDVWKQYNIKVLDEEGKAIRDRFKKQEEENRKQKE